MNKKTKQFIFSPNRKSDERAVSFESFEIFRNKRHVSISDCLTMTKNKTSLPVTLVLNSVLWV